MNTEARAYLLLRSREGPWTIKVFRGLEELLSVWNTRLEDPSVAVIHIGFWRPQTRDLEPVVQSHSGKVLLTAAAVYGLPPEFRASKNPIAFANSLPIHLALRGWGYLLEDEPEVDPKPAKQTATFSGWLSSIITKYPNATETLIDHQILDEQSYLVNEHRLDRELRKILGQERFERLFSDEWNDPCAFARAAPPWMRLRRFDSMELAVRTLNCLAAADIQTVADLGDYSLKSLKELRSFGAKSIDNLLSGLEALLEEGPHSDEVKIDNITHVDFLTAVNQSLDQLNHRGADILRRRMGFCSRPETLQQIAETYSITRERVRQIESKLVDKLTRLEVWDDLLARKLSKLLQHRNSPLPLLGLDAIDSWFRGIGSYPTVLKYILQNMCDQIVSVVATDGVEYVATTNQEVWDSTLRRARQILVGAAEENWTEERCQIVVTGLLADESLRQLFWEKASVHCHFSIDLTGQKILSGVGRGADHIVEAILKESPHPLHFTEIAALASERAARTIDARRAHAAAATVGILLGRGTYGAERHLPIDEASLKEIASDASDIVCEDGTERQWHSSEILTALIDRGSSISNLVDKYVLNVGLRHSDSISYLGRMMWEPRHSVHDLSSARIDIRQAIVAMLQSAGKPLRTSEIHERLTAIRGLNERFQVQPIDPVIRVGLGIWGLNDRDVLIKRSDQPRFQEALVDILRQNQRGIHLSELGHLISSLPGVTATALFSIALLDPRLRVSTSQYIYLDEWEGPRRLSLGEAISKVFSVTTEPVAFDDLVPRIRGLLGRQIDRNAISQGLRAADAIYDPSTGRWRGSLQSIDDDDDEVPLSANPPELAHTST